MIGRWLTGLFYLLFAERMVSRAYIKVCSEYALNYKIICLFCRLKDSRGRSQRGTSIMCVSPLASTLKSSVKLLYTMYPSKVRSMKWVLLSLELLFLQLILCSFFRHTSFMAACRLEIWKEISVYLKLSSSQV